MMKNSRAFLPTLLRDFGYICVGISIYAILEIGICLETVALMGLSLFITIGSYPIIRRESAKIKDWGVYDV